MKIYKEESLLEYDFYGVAREHADLFTVRQLDLIEDYLEEMYPNGIDDYDLNDIFANNHEEFIQRLRDLGEWEDRYANFHDEDIPGDTSGYVEMWIPASLLCAFVNDDTSGLEDEDIRAMNEFKARWEDRIDGFFDEWFIPNDEAEPEFIMNDDVFMTGCDAYRFLVKTKKAA